MSSKKYQHGKRDWFDGLLLTNLVYVLASIFSFVSEQYTCAILQFGAAIASTLFHRSRETKFLPVDACISGTLGIIWGYAFFHVLEKELHGFLCYKLIQAIACVFTWVYCGMPGGHRYETWHKRWHYVSGWTTFSSSVFLCMYVPEFDTYVMELLFSSGFIS